MSELNQFIDQEPLTVAEQRQMSKRYRKHLIEIGDEWPFWMECVGSLFGGVLLTVVAFWLHPPTGLVVGLTLALLWAVGIVAAVLAAPATIAGWWEDRKVL